MMEHFVPTSVGGQHWYWWGRDIWFSKLQTCLFLWLPLPVRKRLDMQKSYDFFTVAELEEPV